jgi:intracellular multiplication protein IcmK
MEQRQRVTNFIMGMAGVAALFIFSGPIMAQAADPASAAASVSSPVADGPAPSAAQPPAQDPAPTGTPAVPSLMDTLSGQLPSLADKRAQQAAASSVGVPSAQAADGADIPGMDLPFGSEQPAPLSAEEKEEQMRSRSFESMMNGMLPLEPDEIRDAFTRMDRNQKAVEEPLAYPKPEVSFTTISLDPGVKPMTFKLATGHVSTVSFLDITGQPWPIKDMTWAGNFEVKSATQNADEKFPMYPNIMRIIPLSEYAYGNLSVRLVGLQTPLTFTLRTGREVVQYRLDIRVPEDGPLAVPSLIAQSEENKLTAGDETLTRVMEGIPPPSALKMRVSGVDGRTTAYKINGLTYVRTPFTLLSPAWNGSVRSADGMNVYALADAPVLLLSDQGEMVRAQLKELEEKTNEQSAQ